MPRAKKAAAVAQPFLPLANAVIAVSGKPELPNTVSDSIEALIKTLGGTIVKSVTKKATHVVASRAHWEGRMSLVETAKAKDLPVVSADWVIELSEGQTVVAIDEFCWDAIEEREDQEMASQQLQPATSGKTASKKRPIAVASPTQATNGSDTDAKKPKAKKTKAAADTNGLADKMDIDSEVKDDVAEGQFIKKQGTVIPVDSRCELCTHQVYIEEQSGLIYDASLNQTNASHNNNKFYIVQLLTEPKNKDFRVWTRWGRVGEPGTSALLGDGTFADALKNFEKKFKDKSGLKWDDRNQPAKPGKYSFVEKSYESDDEEEEDDDSGPVKKEEDDKPAAVCKLAAPIQGLMNMIFNHEFIQAALQNLNYDANKLPLGKLGKATILKAFEKLKELAALLDDPTLAASRWNKSVPIATEHLSNGYYSLIPHDFGRRRPPIISDKSVLKKELELLESLSDMKVAADLMKVDKGNLDPAHPLDKRFESLDLKEMTPLKKDSEEFKLLQGYLVSTKGDTHHMKYEVIDIFRIERKGERERFASSKYSSISSDRRLLWHGSRCTNFGSILSQGLRIAPPEAPVSGYMFGKGIYLADMSSKSANYCCSYVSNNEGLLLLCEAELGDPMQELVDADYNAGDNAMAKGVYTTKGLGDNAPREWIDASAVNKDLKGVRMPNPAHAPTNEKLVTDRWNLAYNEYICYDVDQVQLKYLFRVKM